MVYPERKEKAGVVLVIHDIRGMRTFRARWAISLRRTVSSPSSPISCQGRDPNGGGTDSLGNGVGQAIQALTDDEVNARLNAAMEYGKKLPASNGKVGVIGFCWGGTRSFGYAVAQPGLSAAVVVLRSAPGDRRHRATDAEVAKINAPVLACTAATTRASTPRIPPTEAAMKKLSKSYETNIFEGAGHGFMGSQAGAAARI